MRRCGWLGSPSLHRTPCTPRHPRPALLNAPAPAPCLLQIQAKLKLAGVDAVYLTSTGERVTQLDQLQDIDELHIVEVRCAPAPPQPYICDRGFPTEGRIRRHY